jgi:hypothetical protein
MHPNINLHILKREIYKMITIIALLNFIMIIIQRLNFELGLQIIKELNNNESYEYAVNMIQMDTFQRCFGLLPYPMHLGIFSLLSLAFLMFEQTEKFHFSKMIFAISILNGIMSASKSFTIGMAVLLILWLFTYLYFSKRTIVSIIKIGIVFFIVMFLFIFFDWIYYIIEFYLGFNYARYWGFIKNVSEAFSTRYSSDFGLLNYMPEFFKTFWLLGVGPSSIRGEVVMDSAPYVILHNGGIMVLIPIVFFYFKNLIKQFQKKELQNFFLFLTIVITGFGFQTWIAAETTTWVLFYLLYENGFTYIWKNKS